ncbi:MAG TPA: hypothetical protein VL461_01195 [Dictyobacter sp.]|jgi:hypothetical protein|nr:hypothetical protein [Dictyobacter sp.]
MIYYRVAFRLEQPVNNKTEKKIIWRWRSTMLTSPHALFTLLRAYNYVPKEQIRVFFASSEYDMDMMLRRQNQGKLSSSMTADQFLSTKRINSQDVKRLELELSTAADHDVPYVFSAPETLREIATWTRLMSRVRAKELIS